MRTYKTGYAVVAALVAFALMVPSVQAAQLNNITVGRFQDFTVVTLFGDAPVSVSHQAIEAKGGKPNRIVVDLTGVEHALPKNNFDELPTGSIARIRTSQFAVSPEPVVRVVLDLAVAAAYKLETEGNSVRIMVSLPSDPPMASVWSAKTTPVMAQAAPAGPASEAPAVDQSQTESTIGEPVIEEPAIADAAPLAAVIDEHPAVGPAPIPEPVESEEPNAEPANLPDSASIAAAKTDDARPAKSASSASMAVARMQDVPPASPDAPDVPLPMPKHKGSEVIDYNFPRPGAVAMTDEPASAAPAQAAPAESAPAETTPVETAPAETAPAPKKAITRKAATEPANVESPAPEPVLANTETSEASDKSSAEPQAEPERVVTQDQATQESGAPELSDAQAGATEYAAAEDGSAPIASLSTLPPLEADASSVVPARSKIVYHTNGRRDPFLPLLQVGAAYNAAALPDVNNLRLVGLLHDVDESWGLFEDANGFGYILRIGDRVKNGRLNKLTQTRAYFQLNEFGWSRSVELELEPEG